MRLSAVISMALLAGTAVSQIALPPHSNTYNGFTRGYQFTSSIGFFIVGLDLPLDAFQAGDTAAYLVQVNGVVAVWSRGNTGAIPTNIQINTGDVVQIYGNWSPVVTTNFTAHNSYTASVTGYATTIEGVGHTVYRTGWQWDIGDPAWVATGATGTSLGLTTTGQLGRVNVFTSAGGSGGVIATNATLGQGCIRQYGSFFENFASSASFDLANTAITMIPSGVGYVVISSGAFLPVGSVQATPTVLALTDDSEVTQPFTTGTFPGWTAATVCSNGFVSKAVGNGVGLAPDPVAMLAMPQDVFCIAQHDYNPAGGGGQVKWEESSSVISITWDGVWDFAGTSPNTLQIQLYPTGMVTMAWGIMSTLGNGFLTGSSPGGPSQNPGPTDISALGTGSIVLSVPEILPLTLQGTSRPVTGTNWNLNVTNVPATGTIGLDVFGLADPGINDLAFLGAPTCGIRASLDFLNAWLVAGATHGYSLAIPNDPALYNFHVYTTSVVLQPGVNSLLGGVITANGIDGKIGNL